MRVGDAVLRWITDDPRRAFRGISHADLADEIGYPRRAVAQACQRLARVGVIVATPRWEIDIHETYDGTFYDGGLYRIGNAYELAA